MKLTSKDHTLLCCGIRPSGVRPGELVPLAAATARITTPAELENPNSLERLYVARGRLQRTLHSSFPVEAQVKEMTSRVLKVVTEDITRLEHVPVYNLPTLDPSFLSWKTADGYPGFSIYSLEDPLCRITFNANIGRTLVDVSPMIPDMMARFYLDDTLRSRLHQECELRFLSRITLTAQYGGAMPSEVRDRIHYYTDRDTGAPQFDSIFIVAEAPEWKTETVSAIPIGDPLVVGVAHGLLWLIATYDLTKVESMVCSLCRSTDVKVRKSN